MIVLDTSGIFAALNPDQPHGEDCREAIARDSGPLVLCPFVLAEVDYFLVQASRTPDPELAFLDQVTRGNYLLAPFEPSDVDEARSIIRRYADLRIGLTDASIVVLAERYETNRVLTLDERHFRAMRPRHARSFVVLPADA